MLFDVAQPTADVTNFGWDPSPLCLHLSTPTPNDGNPVYCQAPPGGYFDVQLGPLGTPIAGPQTLTVRFLQTIPNVALVSFFLLQGGPGGPQVIAGRSVMPTQSFVSYTLVLTAAETALITNYQNLLVRVVAGSPGGSGCLWGSGSGPGSRPTGVIVRCCPTVLLPTTLHLSISNVSGCACMAGTYPLTWNPNTGWWSGGGFTICGFPNVQITLSCNPSPLSWGVYLGGTASPLSLVSCSPLLLLANNVSGGSFCQGTINMTVTT